MIILAKHAIIVVLLVTVLDIIVVSLAQKDKSFIMEVVILIVHQEPINGGTDSVILAMIHAKLVLDLNGVNVYLVSNKDIFIMLLAYHNVHLEPI